MYKFKGKVSIGTSCFPINNQTVERAIDFVSGDFVINKFGHIRSDFAILTDTCNGAEMAKALNQMQQMYSDNSSQFDGMTFEQMVKAVRPRWCQLPGEVDRFEQYLIDEALDFYKQLRQDAEDIEKLDNPNSEPLKPATLSPTSPSE